MSNAKYIVWLLAVIFLGSCARQSAPNGGPMDTIPPSLVRSLPKNQQLNVQSSTLELEFDEIVALSSPKEQLIITPTIGKDYKIEARQKKVLITFENPLEDSTTYSFNFRETVKDVTEQNPAENLKIAFSTGSYIDSMTVEGVVRNALTQREVKDATVSIQAYSDTFNIFTDPATFFTKTDEKGKFKLDNLKPGLYILYAIGDQNKNLIADPKSEAYAFKSDSILLDEDKKNIVLNTVRLDVRELKLTSARPYNTFFNIKTSKNLKTYNIASVDDSAKTYATFGADRANILLYNTFQGKDSIRIRTVLTDSIDNTVDSTFYAKFPTREVKPEKFTIELREPFILADKASIEFILKLSKPLREINYDSIYFQPDTVTTIRFDQSNTSYDERDRILTIKKNLDKALFIKSEPTKEASPKARPDTTTRVRPDKQTAAKSQKKIKHQLTLGKAAIMSIEGDSSQRIQQTLSPQSTDNLGVLIIETKLPPNKVILQLLNTERIIKRETIHKSSVTFADLPPGTYMVRMIVDSNGNGQWDPGNYFTNTEPEEIRYWRSEKDELTIPLKANHEIGPLLISY
jgi:uncharacterized protein (DUF2141 family)